ncbi:MAG: VOC family protein [Aestuariibacter sp.]
MKHRIHFLSRALFCLSLLLVASFSLALHAEDNESSSEKEAGMIRFKKMKPTLNVEDVYRTTKFYVEVLGFTLNSAVADKEKKLYYELPPEEKLIYALVTYQDVEIIIQLDRGAKKEKLPKTVEQRRGKLAYYFEVENIGKLYDKVKEKVSIVRGLHKTWYGVDEFYIRDCDDRILAFGQ